jgi:tape measure domain-containing protein
MAENLGASFSIDITQLKAGLAQANRLIRESESEFKAAAAGMDDWTTSQAGLEKKIKSLNDIAGLQEKKVEALKAEYSRLISAGLDPASAKATELRTKINNETAALEKSKVEIAKQTAALSELQSESSDTAKETENLTSKVKRQESELKTLKSHYADVAAEQGDTSDEAKELARQISDLSGELKDNKTKLKDAADAADDLDQSLDNAADSAESAGSGGFTVFKGVVADLASNAISNLVGSVKSLVGEVIDASDSMAKFEQTMGFAGYDNSVIAEASERVKEYADRTVYELDTISNTTAQLAANGVKDFSGLTEAAGNLNAVAGGNADTFNSFAMVLTQTAGAGKLTTENWNQLANAIPGASGKLQEALKQAGAYTGDFREAMAKGQITADEFNAAIMKLGNEPVAVEAATSVSTFEGAMGDLQATAVSGLMEIYDTIGRENITGLITKISGLVKNIIPPIRKAIQWFIDHIPEIKVALVALTAATVTYLGYTTAVTVMTKGWMALSVAQKAVTVAQKLMNAAMAVNPIGLVVAAVAALVAAFVALWNKSESFRNFWIGLWEKIKSTVSPVIDGIKTAFQALWDFIKPIIEEIGSMFTAVWGAIKAAWDLVEPYFTKIWENIKAIYSGVAEFFKNIFSAAWEAIKLVWSVAVQYFQLIWNNIKVVFSAVKTTLAAFFTAAWTNIKLVWDTVVSYFKMIWNNIKLIFGVVKDVLSGNFSDAWEKIKEIFANVGEFFGGVWGNIKDAFANVITFFQSIFKIAWNAVKSVFANVGEFFGGIWETIKEKFSTIGTKVADAIGSAFKTAINAVIATVESAINLIPNAINGAIDLINNLPNVNISPIPTISLPRLAKGGVVRRATAAVVGEDGAEAVMPLERNTSWIDLLAEKLAEKTGGGVVVNQTNNYSQAHSRYEIYKSQQATAKAVKLAMAR